MAAMPIYGENPLKIFPRNQWLWNMAYNTGDRLSKVHLNDDPGLTLIFMVKSNLAANTFIWENA